MKLEELEAQLGIIASDQREFAANQRDRQQQLSDDIDDLQDGFGTALMNVVAANPSLWVFFFIVWSCGTCVAYLLLLLLRWYNRTVSESRPCNII